MNKKMSVTAAVILLAFLSISGCASRKIVATQPIQENSTLNAKNHNESKTLPSSSLWKGDSLSFLSMNKSWKIGDIVRIKVKIKGEAKFEGAKANNKKSSLSSPITNVLGKLLDFGMGKFPDLIPLNQTAKIGDQIGGGLKSTQDQRSSENISKKQSVNFDIAAVVKEVLPGGNLAIEATQEITVHKEKRKIHLKGIIRPRDINAENCIDSDKIAEAKISYAIDDVKEKKKSSRF
jgi:flagellar L-ring protein precursor FlgH